MPNTVRRVNQSEMTTFMRCPRKWTLGYLRGLAPVTESSKLHLGSLVHLALKEHYRGGDALELLELAEVQALSEAPEETLAEVAKEAELAYLMVQGYLEWLEETGADVGLEIILCEEELEVPLGTIYVPGAGEIDVVLHGTPDLLSRSPDGLLSLYDHKTVAAFGQFLNRRQGLNFQLLTYSWMWWKMTGDRPDAIALNMLRKVKRTASAKPPFYMREPFEINQLQLESHEAHMRQVVFEMLSAEYVQERSYPVPDQDCDWKCEFVTPCIMMDNHPQGAAEMLNELYVRSR